MFSCFVLLFSCNTGLISFSHLVHEVFLLHNPDGHFIQFFWVNLKITAIRQEPSFLPPEALILLFVIFICLFFFFYEKFESVFRFVPHWGMKRNAIITIIHRRRTPDNNQFLRRSFGSETHTPVQHTLNPHKNH
ncbi:hypothetical protein [Escherichia phage BI-EHEC]|nr:hypothetical protein [Escherichia phage BI-EHEC]